MGYKADSEVCMTSYPKYIFDVLHTFSRIDGLDSSTRSGIQIGHGLFIGFPRFLSFPPTMINGFKKSISPHTTLDDDNASHITRDPYPIQYIFLDLLYALRSH